MLAGYLQQSIQDLQTLIDLTTQDLQDIRKARHTSIFERNATKQERIASFEACKSAFDQEMLKLMGQHPQTPLPDLLDQESNNLLKEMRRLLSTLKEINADYARIVFAVSDFYASLLQQIVPHETTGYHKQAVSSRFLQVQA